MRHVKTGRVRTSDLLNPMPPMTISAAARDLGIDRRTVQRYCRREPGIMLGKKVDVESLRAVIAYCKAADGRGFPLRRGRWPRLPLKAPRKEKPVIRRTLIQRLEIIRREIDAMTDAEQVQVLEMGREAFWNCFRGSSWRLFIAKHCPESSASAGKPN
jgi:hypothetical protein